MSKIKIKTLLKKEGKVKEHTFQAIRQKNKILYHDNLCQVTIDLDKKQMIRENEEFRLEMNFIEGETSKNPYLLKQGNGHLLLDIYTYHFQYDKNKLSIDYQVIGSERTYFEVEETI